MHARRGITLMETVIGTLLVGGVLAGTLGVIGPTARATQLAGDEVLASYLANELLAEIEAQPYEDPDITGRVVGPEPGEKTGNRSRFNDVDDYRAWSARPQSAAGVAHAGVPDYWNISVTVEIVNTKSLAPDGVTDTGLKLVKVIVTKYGVVLANRGILRSRFFDTVWSE